MSSDKDDIDDVEILSTHDEKIKLVGEILGNDSSRKILNLLNDDNEMTINQIAQSTKLSLALVTHHIKRMQSANLVKVSRIGKSIKGHKMNYYVATNHSLLIVPSKNPIPSIKNSLKKFSKFVAIGLAGVVSWMTLNSSNHNAVDFQSTVEVSRGTAVTSANNLDVNEWSSASESKVDSDLDVEFRDFSSDHEPEPQLTNTRMPEDVDLSHSELKEFHAQLAEESANTGSVSLDRTVYPIPSTASGDSIESVIVSMIIPISVVVGGIILERILNRWWNKRKSLRQNK